LPKEDGTCLYFPKAKAIAVFIGIFFWLSVILGVIEMSWISIFFVINFFQMLMAFSMIRIYYP